MTAAQTSATPTSLAELLEQHAQATVHISGAEQTAWSGKVVEAGEGILGLAHWDGTLHLDRECILNPLEEMYDRSGYPHSDADLIRYREALVTLLHEQSHFLGPVGATQEAARAAFKVPGSRHLEEGVAEAWAHDHLNDYIRHLGIDKVAPGITTVRSEPSYAAFVPAVRLLTNDIDRQANLPHGETLHRLNRQTAEHQWPVAVDLIYRSTRLPHLVPPDQQPGVRFHLEKALRTSFQALETYEPFPRGFASSRSHSAGTRILTLLHNNLTITESHYTPTHHRPTTKAATSEAPATKPAVPVVAVPESATVKSPTPKPIHQDPQAAFHQALSGLAPPTPSTHDPTNRPQFQAPPTQQPPHRPAPSPPTR
ncbi:hypothetical protein EV644_103430 [Kribbella orskensis]|uniref:Uncharacterized protein n=1 Tax=Kribbella orskensis TaxID=2512216 RepID=A0ABY2BQ35_9ACTN|nr:MULTISPECIES: hypothetical protein [Kribbella]TCN37365.1 hypothetical protein EV642_112232 [Kribbella sp. VKM Ac-2500]TCO27727.1 hypothetical protein EV644_103430 [Kribbella orskensis]